MKLRKILIIVACLIAILMPCVQAKEPEITATSGMVIDCIDGKILYSKNADEKLYPASLTKVLTAILVVEKCGLQDNVTINQSAIDKVESGYLTANLKTGEVFTVEQLLNLLLISSYDDVANALAEYVAGSEEEFVKMMNEKAKEVGCTNSNFLNCHGEHDTNHYSTAHDMALIANHAVKFETIRNIAQVTEYGLPATTIYTGNDRYFYTSNEMLQTGSKNYYKYAKGLKTGFTTPAGNCLMAYAEKSGLKLVSVTMKSTTSNSRYEDSEAILEYAFDTNTIRTIAEAGTNIQTVTVKKARKEDKKLNMVLEKPITAVVKVENEETPIEPQINLNSKIKAPIKKGTVLGTVSYEIEGKTYTGNLIAENDVKKSKTGLVFLLIFIGLIVLFGGLRVLELYKRNQTLNKIRGKNK